MERNRRKIVAGVVKCRICKQPIEQKAGRGRIKEIHTECGQYESALSRVQRFLESEVVWANPDALKTQKGDIMEILNRHANTRNARYVENREAQNAG